MCVRGCVFVSFSLLLVIAARHLVPFGGFFVCAYDCVIVSYLDALQRLQRPLFQTLECISARECARVRACVCRHISKPSMSTAHAPDGRDKPEVRTAHATNGGRTPTRQNMMTQFSRSLTG